MFCVIIFFFGEGVGVEGGEGWLEEGRYLCVCVCVCVGGGLLTTMAAGLHTKKITTVCEITCMTIIQYTNNDKAF